MTKIFSRVLKKSIIVASVAVFIASAFIPLISHSQALAKTSTATGSASTDGLDDKSYAFMYYYAIKDCFGSAGLNKLPVESGVNSITKDDLSNGKIFKDYKIDLGKILDKASGKDSDGVVNCNNNNTDKNWLVDGITQLGFRDARDLLCYMAFNPTKGGSTKYDSCSQSSGSYMDPAVLEGDLQAKFVSAAQDKYWGGGTPQSRADIAAMRQRILYRTLRWGGYCQAAFYASGTVINENEGVSVYDISYLSLGLNAVDEVVTIPKSQDGKVLVSNSDSGGQSGRLTCEQMINFINDDQPDVIAWRATILEGDVKKEATTSGPGAENTASTNPTCQAGPLGWVLCPLINSLAGLSDLLFSTISSLLETSPMIGNSDDTIYNSWTTFRDIANIALGIGFMIIIYSMATGGGLTNYSVKKVLPRLILVAIAINISYYICAAAIDLSNIIGRSLYDLFKGLVSMPIEASWDTMVSQLLFGAAATGGAIAFIAFSGGAAAAAWAILPVIIMAVLSFLIALLTLWFRNVVIILLILIAPVAFAAYLLPNTEQWFKKWWKLFLSMLMIYPIAGALFGGAYFIGCLMIETSENPLSQIAGMLVMALPLVSLPFLVRQSGSFLGKMQSAISGGTGKLRGPIQGWSGGHKEESEANWLAKEPSRLNLARRGRQSAAKKKYARSLTTQAWQAQHQSDARNAFAASDGAKFAGYDTAEAHFASLQSDATRKADEALISQWTQAGKDTDFRFLEGEMMRGNVKNDATARVAATLLAKQGQATMLADKRSTLQSRLDLATASGDQAGIQAAQQELSGYNSIVGSNYSTLKGLDPASVGNMKEADYNKLSAVKYSGMDPKAIAKALSHSSVSSFLREKAATDETFRANFNPRALDPIANNQNGAYSAEQVAAAKDIQKAYAGGSAGVVQQVQASAQPTAPTSSPTSGQTSTPQGPSGLSGGGTPPPPPGWEQSSSGLVIPRGERNIKK